MKKIISLLLLFLSILPLLCLNVSAEEDLELTRYINYCVKESIVAENEKDAYLADADTDLGSVAILVSRIAGAPIFENTADASTSEEDGTEISPITEAELIKLKQDALNWATENAIIPAPDGANTDPLSKVSREEFSVIVSNLVTYLGKEVKVNDTILDKYKDNGEISDWAVDSMKMMLTNDILNENKVISPKDTLTSKELLGALMNFDKYVNVDPKPQNDNSVANKADKEENEEKDETPIVITVSLSLAKGFLVTIELFLTTLLFALPLGLIFSFGSMSKFKPIKWFMKTFIWIIRGTPLMLQLIVIFYGPGLLSKWAVGVLAENPTMNLFVSNFFLDWIESVILFVMEWLASWGVWDRFLAVSVAFVINYSCYFSEIFRGGIESISKGQYEAGQVLGMTKVQVFFRVVLLQVVKRIIPPMSNEIITLVKDTSLARTISVYEIIWAGQAFIKSDGLIWPLFYTGAFYLIFNGLLTILFGKLEKKLDYFRG